MPKRLTYWLTVALIAGAIGCAQTVPHGEKQTAGYACADDSCQYDSTVTLPYPPTHNARGGYIDACGDLPGLVGDDC
jgi:hypothetical protein